MGKVKEALLSDEFEEDEDFWDDLPFPEAELNDIRFNEVPEIVSYLSRHRLEYLFYLQNREATNYPEAICDNEEHQKEFLVSKIIEKPDNENILVVLQGISRYRRAHLWRI